LFQYNTPEIKIKRNTKEYFMICPYCDMEISETAFDHENGCCPECGAVISPADITDDSDDFDDLDAFDDDDADDGDGVDDMDFDDLDYDDQEFDDEELDFDNQ
jgi:hypothetical protein